MRYVVLLVVAAGSLASFAQTRPQFEVATIRRSDGPPQIDAPDWLSVKELSAADHFDVMARVPAGSKLTADCKRISGADLAQQIQALAPGYLGEGPVVNMTDLKGSYAFQLEWVTVEQFHGGDSPSLFDSVEKQLGLKFDNRKQPMSVLKIEHVDRMPTDN